MAFIRAREIEAELRNRGHERGTLWVLQTLAEQQIALQNDMRDLAALVNQMSDITTGLVGVGEQMKHTIERLNSDRLFDDDMPKNTQDM